MNGYFIYQHRYNKVKIVKSRTVSTGQKGSKALTSALKYYAETSVINSPEYDYTSTVQRRQVHQVTTPKRIVRPPLIPEYARDVSDEMAKRRVTKMPSV